MSNVHLNEEQFQDYAIAGITDPAAMAHLTGCGHCQVQIKAYQTLYRHIREAETPLLDLKTEDLIPDRLPAINAEDRKEVRYLYGLLLGTIALLIAGLVGFWSKIRWIFVDFTPLAISIGLLLLSGLLIVRLIELYSTYRKKLSALNMA